MTTLKNVIKSTSSTTGAAKHKEVTIHLTQALPAGTYGRWDNKALCGIRPDKRSNGWCEVLSSANCTKCLKINNKI